MVILTILANPMLGEEVQRQRYDEQKRHAAFLAKRARRESEDRTPVARCLEGARVPMYLKQRHDAEQQAQQIVAALDVGDRFHVDRVKNEEQDHQERNSSIERRKEPCEQDIDQYAAEREQQHVDEMTSVGAADPRLAASRRSRFLRVLRDDRDRCLDSPSPASLVLPVADRHPTNRPTTARK